MTSFDVSTLEIFVYGTVATVSIGYIIERILTWHESKSITIQKRTDEFIDLSKDWYMPLAHVIGEIVAETDPEETGIRPKVLFFKLAKFLSLYHDFSELGVGYIFPKETQEKKVIACDRVFNKAVRSLVFNDDKELVEHVIERCNKNYDFLSFINKIEELPEYDAFKSTIGNGNIGKMLYESADEFSKSITDGVTEEYKQWYKFEVNKKKIGKKIQNYREETYERIEELRKELSRNRGDCMDKVPNVR